MWITVFPKYMHIIIIIMYTQNKTIAENLHVYMYLYMYIHVHVPLIKDFLSNKVYSMSRHTRTVHVHCTCLYMYLPVPAGIGRSAGTFH